MVGLQKSYKARPWKCTPQNEAARVSQKTRADLTPTRVSQTSHPAHPGTRRLLGLAPLVKTTEVGQGDADNLRRLVSKLFDRPIDTDFFQLDQHREFFDG